MDQYLILEFETLAAARRCLDVVNNIASAYWAGRGYSIIDGTNGKELIGKKNGESAPQSARTLTWDVIKQSPEGTYYFTSLRNDARFSGGMPELESAFSFTEKPLPQEWVYDVEMS